MARRIAPVRLGDAVIALDGGSRERGAFFDLVGDARVVLIGEATHGTHEFYRTRAELTKRLIAERDFTAVCIEGDWPDAYRVNRYVRGAPDDAEAIESLRGFERFPTWVWRNAEVLDFVEWLREHNDARAARNAPKTGFYGLDLYSMYASIDAVLVYLDRIDPAAAARARARYACLEPFERHPERYPLAMLHGTHHSCRSEVLEALFEIGRHAAAYARRDGRAAEDEYFFAEQNARIVANAEAYYGAMLDDAASTWNLRDAHMFDTLQRLIAHLSVHRPGAKAVVWAHNSHVGDARATSMSLRGETNIGAMARADYGERCVSIGFTTYSGTVAAASDWHAPEERTTVLPARADSYERALHDLHVPQFMLPLRPQRPHLDGLPAHALERAIGVIYRPDTELQSHYFSANVLQQFDAIYHFDRTRAVQPLERSALWHEGEPPEAYPSGV